MQLLKINDSSQFFGLIYQAVLLCKNIMRLTFEMSQICELSSVCSRASQIRIVFE